MGQCAHGTVDGHPSEIDALPLASALQINDIEVGTAEALVLAQAPRQPWPEPTIDALRADGVILIPAVLSAATASALRGHLEAKLAASLDAIASGAACEHDCFEPVPSRKERHFMQLALEPKEVVEAVVQALRTLAPFLRAAFECADPMLAELASIRSTRGAPPQPIHQDDYTPCSGPPGRLSAFVALQDIDEPMGPTWFLPGTHSDVHKQNAMTSRTRKAQLFRAGPVRLGTGPTGACTLHHTGVLHAGGANRSCRGRWLFHMTFVPEVLQFTCLDYYKPLIELGVYTLGELERGVLRARDDGETVRLKAQWTLLLEDPDISRLKAEYDRHVWAARAVEYDLELWMALCRYKVEAALAMAQFGLFVARTSACGAPPARESCESEKGASSEEGASSVTRAGARQ